MYLHNINISLACIAAYALLLFIYLKKVHKCNKYFIKNITSNNKNRYTVVKK